MTDIVLEAVTIGYSRDKPLLKDVNLVLRPGLHLLLGPNGSGKTAFLKTVAGLLKPLSGRVLVKGIEPYREKRSIVARIIGLTWQDPYYGFIEPRVRDEIFLIIKHTGAAPNYEIVEKLVPSNLLERDPFTLSGGEAKRVSIASVLIADQDVWLLDEPFDNLDLEGIIVLSEILNKGVERGKNIIVALNNPLYGSLLKTTSVLIIDRERLGIEVLGVRELNDEILAKYNIIPKAMLCH
ncbi:ABC transporter ATP-binding protein [Thermogladius sp. 4427co]|uniref:ABC transporter ATP-binding protein n=1 Tax=Thermogladius sp. 4427co TaxID=3450718 RepID=UPI003F78D35C